MSSESGNVVPKTMLSVRYRGLVHALSSNKIHVLSNTETCCVLWRASQAMSRGCTIGKIQSVKTMAHHGTAFCPANCTMHAMYREARFLYKPIPLRYREVRHPPTSQHSRTRAWAVSGCTVAHSSPILILQSPSNQAPASPQYTRSKTAESHTPS